ncbi:hypothetical protein K438DRAFT_1987232 [Mycena galopus ATCC 62051]|nr:hypothetical protein K438DRAFT_1987232 [Mycena galopus ATCC 62051]
MSSPSPPPQDDDGGLRGASLTQIFTFTRLLSLLKDDIILCQPHNIPTDAPPAFLPPSIELFIAQAAGLPQASIMDLWTAFKTNIWSLSDTRLLPAEEELFRQHGWKLGFTSLTLYPPSHECSTPGCPAKGPMKKPEIRQIVVYTQGGGAVPAHAIHLYCRGCNTNYHHNFSVKDSVRTYYGNTPRYIQIGEHQFAERKLVGLWVTLMLVGWVSATNCARAYDIALSEQQERDFAASGWQFGCTLAHEQVWDGFVTLTLMDYHDRNGTRLEVPHTGAQKDRFTEAMRARNREVISGGQDEIVHCCNKCMRVWMAPDGTQRETQLIVGDATTATISALSTRLSTTSALSSAVMHLWFQGRRRAPTMHTRAEELHYERGKAAFTLRDRLQKHRLAHPHDKTASVEEAAGDDIGDEGEEWFEQAEDSSVGIRGKVHPGSIGVDDSVPCEAAKSDTGNRKYKALFGALRTHNEQILVRPCGVIVSRATFYNAEAVSNVLIHMQKTFSVPRAVKPEHFVYDTACNARQQVLTHPDEWEWFLDVGMSVNVFHFLHKHSITHTFCQEHCTPAKFPELMGPDGGWFFNTSVVEQTNVWLGGYHSMCREMLPVKYNFFLDEMIRLRNEITVAKLAADGHCPRQRVASVST